MVSRSSEANEGQRPLTPSRTPGTPMKPRLARVSTSPTKRDEKPKEDKVLKSSAKDVAELKDYVCLTPGCRLSSRARILEEMLTTGFLSNSNWVIVWGKAPSGRSIEH
jgi:hypothetical protein